MAAFMDRNRDGMRMRRGRFLSQLGTCVIAGGLLAGGAYGQNIDVVDDGNGREMTIVSGPGGGSFMLGGVRFEELLRPHLTSRDARVIAKVLDLDAGQRVLLEVLLDDYRMSFNDAAAELKAAQASIMPSMADMPGVPGGMFVGDGANITLDLDDMIGDALGDVDTIDVEEGEGGSVAIRIGVTSDGPGGAVRASSGTGEDGAVGVMIEATDGEGNSIIPPEVLEKLEERIRERLEKRMADQALADELAAQGLDDSQPAEPEPVMERVSPDELRTIATSFRGQRDHLLDQFYADLETILNEEQVDAVDHCRRDVRRSNQLMRGQLSGESVDIARVAQETNAQSKDADALHDVLSNYAQSLDVALRKRERVLVDGEIAAIDFLEEEDTDARLRQASTRAAARTAVRDVNHQAMQQVLPLLRSDEAKAFENLALAKAFPSLHNKTSADKTIEAALGLDDLEDDTAAAIKDIAAQYHNERAALDQQIMVATLEDEPQQERRMMEFMSKLQNQEPGSDMDFTPPDMGASQDLRMRRMQMTRKADQAVRALLTEEQLEKMPKQRRMFQFGGPGGGGMPTGPGTVIRRRVIDDGDDM